MKIGEVQFTDAVKVPEDNHMVVYKTEDGGVITVLDRLTGYGDGDIRDTETGYRDKEGKFWLASCNFDIRNWPEKTVEEAVEWIKASANTCKGE